MDSFEFSSYIITSSLNKHSFTSLFPIHISVIAFSCLIALVSICNIMINVMDMVGTFALDFRGKNLQY